MAFTLSEGALRRMREAIARFPDRRAGMLPALWVVQEECGYVPPEAMELVAGEIGVSPAQVLQVVSFYTMFHRARPGRHVIQVCRTLSCELMGAGRILEHLGSRLGIAEGDTTPDGEFTLQAVECLAGCGRAPVLQVDEEYCEDVTPETADAILEACRAGRGLPEACTKKGAPGWPSSRS